MFDTLHGIENVVEAKGYDISPVQISLAGSGSIPYGTAMGLNDSKELITDQKKLSKLGNTISPIEDILLTREGKYDARARFCTENNLKLCDYFTPKGNGMVINKNLNIADFEVRDITEKFYEEPKDFIFCLSAMYQFNDESIINIVRNVDANLKEGGFFICYEGDCEEVVLMNQGRYKSHSTYVHQKMENKSDITP